MAAGEQVALNRRVYLNEDKTAVVDDDAVNKTWFLGGPGHVVGKDDALRLGLTEEDFGPIPNAMDAILAQERRNRETLSVSENTVVEPLPVRQDLETQRRAYHRETGEALFTDGSAQATQAATTTASPLPTRGVEARGEESAAPDDADDDVETKQSQPSENKAVTSAPETRSRAGGATRER